MKKILSTLLIGLLLVSCKNEETKTDGYIINGSAKGVYNGVRAYLKTTDETGRRHIPVDTAIIMEEKFVFQGKVDHPQMWFFSVSGVDGFIPVMIENSNIKIDFDKNNFENTKVTGTKANEALKIYNEEVEKLVAVRKEINMQSRSLNNSPDSVAKKEVTAKFLEINEKLNSYPLEFVKDREDTHFSLAIIENQLNTVNADINKIDEAFEGLNDELKSSTYGQAVHSKLLEVKKIKESQTMLEIGKVAPDFSGPDPDGKVLSLNDVKGKVTIIDFWASWCGPCRKENPNVVKVYEKFHKKGLEIIGVSLDRPGQKDKWLKAIEDDNLTWQHISNLNYFNGPIAQQYSIRSIPATFILDAEGKIVAKNLRGKALEDKIAQMLN